MVDRKAESADRPDEARGADGMDERVRGAVRLLRSGAESESTYQVLDGWLRPRLSRYFRAHGFRHSDAEDLVQNTLARVYQGVRQLEHEERFLGWLFTIARNVRMTAVGQTIRDRSVAVADGDSPVDPAEPARAPASEFAPVWAAIDALPAQQRQCLMLRVKEELSYEEIATLLKLSANTVRNHIALAKKNLRKVLVRGEEVSE